MSFIYLAQPYTHRNPAIMYGRWRAAEVITGQALRDGQHVFSPIVHCHRIADEQLLPVDASFWWEYNKSMLTGASSLWILMLPGWEKSKGLAQERQFMSDCGKPERMIDPNTYPAYRKICKLLQE